MSNDYQDLIHFLSSPERPEGTLNYNQLRGFLFAIVSIPEPAMPDKWMPLIFNQQDANFASDEEATARMNDIVNLYQSMHQDITEGTIALPEECEPADEMVDNFEDENPFTQWVQGFGGGHFYFEQEWLKSVPEDLQDEFASCVLVLTFFTNRDMAKAYSENMPTAGSSVEETGKMLLGHLNEAIESYASLGRHLSELNQQKQSNKEPVTSTKIGRNVPCPCGSGKKYKHCCGK